MTERCPSCRGALPGGCSTCRPMPILCTRVAHNHQSTGSIPVAATSLSGLIAAAVEAPRYRTEAAWKRDTFPQETQ